MLLNTRTPTLTGVQVGGLIVRPITSSMSIYNQEVRLITQWIARLTLAPPIQNPPPDNRPTLLTERVVGPGVG